MIDGLSIVIPAYNEARDIETALIRLKNMLLKMGVNYEVILVDDGSQDDTSLIAMNTLPELILIRQEMNLGKGAALRLGFFATSNPFILFLDADLDLDPSYIPIFLKLIETENADIVIGSKTHADSVVQYPKSRRILSLVWRKLVFWKIGLDLSDTQTGFKLLRRATTEESVGKVISSGFAFDLELLQILSKQGRKIIEGPVKLDFGFSSTVTFRTGLNALRELHNLEKNLIKSKKS